MSWRACAHCHRECHCHSVSQSHIAKGPEIEPRHRLVPAVGIMRLVAGQAHLLRQCSFACIGGTNVCLCVWFALLVAWHGCGMRPALRCVCAWASLGCKCLFASVGEALALACCVGMGRCMRGEGRAG